jgi:hypothetical protein
MLPSNESGILAHCSILASLGLTSRYFHTPESTQAQTLERSVSRSSTDVGHNDQFKNGDPGEVKLILLDLATCVGGTEIPLLAHNLSKRASTIPRPSQDELLGTFRLGFFEDERDACESLWLIED